MKPPPYPLRVELPTVPVTGSWLEDSSRFLLASIKFLRDPLVNIEKIGGLHWDFNN